MSRSARRRKNLAYLRGLSRKYLQPIPSRYALEVGRELYSRMIRATVVDSGQAAANWQFIPYISDPKRAKQKMLWGYDDKAPTYPVGYKSWYSSGQHAGGSIDQIEGFLTQHADRKISGAPLTIKGVLIYNPITPGFSQFAPGNDKRYEQRALETAYIEAPAAQTAALSVAERKMRQIFPALR